MAELLEEKRHALSGWSMIAAWVAMLIFGFHASTHMVAAGDTWVAMACGRHFINHGVDTVEPFSANSHKAGPTEEEVAGWPGWAQWITNKVGLETVKKIHPTGWVNQNWLTHVIFYWLTHLSPVADAENYSFNSLVYWKVALYIATVIVVYYTGRILGASPALVATFACFAMFVSRSFLDIRPAGFSNLLVAAFLLILVLATYRNILYIWLTIPMTVFWCNVHGGYIYVFIMLAVFFGLHFLAAAPVRWTTSLQSIVIWAAAYFLSLRFLSSSPSEQIGAIFTSVSPVHDTFLYVVLILAGISVAAAASGKMKAEAFYGYHAASTLVVLLWGMVRLMTKPNIRGLSPGAVEMVREHIYTLQQQYLVAAVVLICLGAALMLLKDRLIRLSAGKLVHVGAVGILTFAGCMIFNPFHLTNFTHTFVISVSKHAKMWRTVHEWHPAFAWSNPVGSGFPYLVMLLLTIGVLIFWLLSRFLRSNSSTTPKATTGRQSQLRTLNGVLGWIVLVFVLWVTCVSLSLCPATTGFFVCIVLAGVILLSIRFNIHAIFMAVPALLIIAGVAHQYKGHAGTYIFPFLIVPTFVCFFLVASVLSEKTKYKSVNIVYAAVASVITIVLMAVWINPFKFQPVSENFGPIDYISQFFSITRPWRPAYETNLGVLTKAYNAHLFGGIYIANIIALGIWFAVPIITQVLKKQPEPQKQPPVERVHTIPRIDLVYMTIVLLTVYMAYASRRFIPIAAYAACPLLAMLIDQTVRSVSASLNFCKRGRFEVPPMPRQIERFFVWAGVLVTLAFGTFCLVRFKQVYLDPCHIDAKLTSAFMRMTASHAKPFWAMQFIRDNHLSGKMFNYWTEGGFIAYGQDPDPNTGRTPLQLFMDGRAQAAYEPEAFLKWNEIMGGTAKGAQIVESATVRGRRLTNEEYLAVGYALSEALRKEDVWVVLMPLDSKTELVTNALEQHPEWGLVFYGDNQKILVDINTEQGRALFAGIGNGTTRFPDEFSRRLTVARGLLGSATGPEAAKAGLENAVAALNLEPSHFAMQEILSAQSSFGPVVASICKQFVDDFAENKSRYTKENGYFNRYASAMTAASFLTHVSRDEEAKKRYRDYLRSWSNEVSQVNERVTW